jgi:transcriptional regulator MraZ
VRRRFRGESVHKVDQKGRVSVPAPFRRVLEDGDPDWTEGLNPNFVIIYGRPGRACLEGYSIQSIGEIDDMIATLPRFSREREIIERFINTRSVYAQVDENGRVLLPAKLRELVGLGDEALFAGMGDKFQIWTPEAYAADEARIASEIGAEDADPFELLDRMLRGAGGP